MGKGSLPLSSSSLPINIVTLFFFLFFITPPLSVESSSPKVNVWPKPRTFSWPIPQSTLLSPLFTITSPYHIHLTPAVNRYSRLIQTEHHRPLTNPAVKTTTLAPLTSLTIDVTDLSAPLYHGVDESYTLIIPTVGPANLTAETVWGAMRGLETFSQLVYGEPSMVAVGVEVWDAPIFGHRGVMLDTSRNYYEVEDLLRTIEAMSYNKMNVFHWHITDSHSFPIVLPSEPDLADKGSYGLEMLYTVEDVERIVKFGFEHGVRVLPEIDSPG